MGKQKFKNILDNFRDYCQENEMTENLLTIRGDKKIKNLLKI